MINKILRYLTIFKLNRNLVNFKPKKNEFLNYHTNSILDPNSILETIMNGGIVLSRNFLQKNDFVKEFENSVGENFHNLHLIHKLNNNSQLIKKIIKQRSSFQTLLLQTKISSTFVSNLLLDQYFCELEPNIRMHVPYKTINSNEIEKIIGSGQATPHAVHKDSWYHHPKNTINIWIAGTETNLLSGLSILPKSHNYNPKFKNFELENYKDCIISDHTVMNLNKGDAIFFLAELLHGSIINQSDDTRVTLSMRLCLNIPHEQKTQYWYQKMKFDNKWKFLFFRKKNISFDPLKDINLSHLNQDFKNKFNLEIIKFDEKYIFLKDKKNIIKKFRRKCPHKGVDLLNGCYVENGAKGSIVCPAHRLLVNELIQ